MSLKKNFLKNLDTPIIIGEVSANHNGSIDKAKKLIKCAKTNNLDFVKLQTYEEHTMTIPSKNKEFLIKKGIWKNYSLWDLYKKAKTPFSWHKELFLYAKKIGIKCISTPFDESAVDLLEDLGCPMYKISSFELTHLPLIKKVAKTKKPVIISTGMGTLNEIKEAVNVVKKHGIGDYALLYCVSNYPANIDEFNLQNIKLLKKKFNCTVGLSDHSTNNDIAKLSIVYGAKIIEKHIALDNQRKGLDVSFSIKGKKINQFVKDISNISKLIRNKSKLNYQRQNLIYRRSIYAASNISKGQVFTKKNIKIIRPGLGLKPKYYEYLIGKKAITKIPFGTPIKDKHISTKLKLKEN